MPPLLNHSKLNDVLKSILYPSFTSSYSNCSYASIDFDIVQPPVITAAAITVGLLGQILPSPSSPLYPLTPSPLPDYATGNMVCATRLCHVYSITLRLFCHVISDFRFQFSPFLVRLKSYSTRPSFAAPLSLSTLQGFSLTSSRRCNFQS
jgi:hypothetical protein